MGPGATRLPPRVGGRDTLAEAELPAAVGAVCCARQLPWPAWDQDSAPQQQDGRCYQTAQLAQRWPPSAAKSGPWAPAAGRGKRRQDVLSCGRQVLSHEPLLTSLATWRDSPTRHRDLCLLAGLPHPGLAQGRDGGSVGAPEAQETRPGDVPAAAAPKPSPASPKCPHLPAPRLLPLA